ncbi:hypothetical protein PEPS_14330 [Persicobacter psychrovividus]|uniref:Uncharacterized protein n=1 Tax=Persicobacter psychrovividus TaxID=387638 RepID=A0ABM7VDZ1_9BACT|nr:hypothetical protein PEPS_14330 [Persicobacter psychrovividus]
MKDYFVCCVDAPKYSVRNNLYKVTGDLCLVTGNILYSSHRSQATSHLFLDIYLDYLKFRAFGILQDKCDQVLMCVSYIFNKKGRYIGQPVQRPN